MATALLTISKEKGKQTVLVNSQYNQGVVQPGNALVRKQGNRSPAKRSHSQGSWKPTRGYPCWTMQGNTDTVALNCNARLLPLQKINKKNYKALAEFRRTHHMLKHLAELGP